MSSPTLQWDHWRSFLAVADEGSLSAAARRLRLTQPTVGRHIDLLEAALGTALFLRAPHGLSLTETGIAMLPEARAMAAAAQALERTASAPQQATAGVVRLAASEVVGVQILPRVLAELLERHPALEIELALSNRNDDLLRHEADLAIRMTRPMQGGLIAHRVALAGIGLYAHRDYLDRRGTPQSLAELSGHVLIGPDRDSEAIAALAQAVPGLSQRMIRFRCDREAAQLNALRASMGIGGCQHGIARRDPALRPVLAGVLNVTLEVWLAMHEDLRASARVRLVHDHLAASLPAEFSPT